MKTGIIIAVLIVLAGGGYLLTQDKGADKMMDKDIMEQHDAGDMMDKDDMSMDDEMSDDMDKDMMDKDDMESHSDDMSDKDDMDTMSDDSSAAAPAVGMFTDYSADKVAMAENGDVVIFFNASWCPSCRALKKDIENNTASIPAGLTILSADYDRETDLKLKYGVTTQHTLVQVDKDGNLIKKWSGGNRLSSVVEQIQ